MVLNLSTECTQLNSYADTRVLQNTDFVIVEAVYVDAVLFNILIHVLLKVIVYIMFILYELF